MPSSSSNEKLFWADRKNRMEKSRLDLILKNMEKEQMYLTHDIDREKRAVVKNFTLVRRTSGVSDQGVPPRNEKDTDYQSAPNYRMGLRLSERRLLEWRENEKQVEKFMHQSAWEMAKVSGKYRRHSSPEGIRLPKRAQSAKSYNRSTSSVGGYTEVKVLDDDVFTNGTGFPTTLTHQSDSVVDLNPKELEKQIFQDYKESIHKTRIPSTSDVLKLKKTRQVRSDSDLGRDEEKRLRFRPHTASVTSHTKRKSLRGFPARPATAWSKIQDNEKKGNLVKNCFERDDIEDNTREILVDYFMTKPSADQEHLSDASASTVSEETAGGRQTDEISECGSDFGSSVSNPSPRTISDRMRALMPEVEDKLKETYINSSITIIYGEGDESNNNNEDVSENHVDDVLQGTDVSDRETWMELQGSTELETIKNNVEDEPDSISNQKPNRFDTEGDQYVTPLNGIMKTDNSSKLDFASSHPKLDDQLPIQADLGDMVDGRYPRSRRKVNRVLTGIAEDKVLTIVDGTSQEGNDANRSHGDDMLSTTSPSSSSRLTSRQRRTSTTSTLTQSDRLSGMYSSMSDIYSIGSDGQRRPSKWRQYVAADTAPVPQKKIVTVTAVVRAALAFSKMARKRALNKLVEEQSTDPVELIRQERLRRLHSRNNILQTITNSWSLNGDNSIPELQEQV
ncbi:uncharacterized protein LOC110455076 [Mizuhopecten yessoensis]|uniref:Uncharacterized protein n=1 Tax=Mizuhopecten yessoensis TaxID=6573 RepID=A0A210QDT2_MIZYE|nr:uncharacterized protein LOC110455076 [Mizuhopecten yessoensis]XP_021360677.1 uncharacterized protein LOC110455076 [Mizuhopecten yessoensis]XP_021360678.1 uncharacterized protein LOC110455076 [Mizuhopecten yessoensis]OWF46879.1 hypothetical protein KP79_PYT07123 [Mizuhopecten yessoensis]